MNKTDVPCRECKVARRYPAVMWQFVRLEVEIQDGVQWLHRGLKTPAIYVNNAALHFKRGQKSRGRGNNSILHHVISH